MPRFVESILSLAELKARTGRANAVVRLDINGKLYKYDAANTATNDDVNIIKPTSVGTGAGAWVNVSRATRYFNKAGEITTPVREFIDTFTPNANPFVIDVSKAGFTQAPIITNVEVLEGSRNNSDYAAAKVIASSTTSITVEFTRPMVGLSIGGAATVRLANTQSGVNGITLLVRATGI